VLKFNVMEVKKLFSMSDTGSHEYCCSIVRIPELQPIEGSDFLAKVEIFGTDIVIRKDQVKTGDLMFYAGNECQLDSSFLSINNLFQNWELNANAEEVRKLMDAKGLNSQSPEVKAMHGYFNDRGRVRTLKLRGVQSFGYLFTKNEMVRYCHEVKDLDLETIINEDFDTVKGRLFVKAYVPYVYHKSVHVSDNGRKRRIKRFDRIIPGQFMFHYDTKPLNKNIDVLNFQDNYVITNKLHGTSVIFANVKCKYPKRFSLVRLIRNLIAKIPALKGLRADNYYIDYGWVYSSRSIVKNKYISSGKIENTTDVWGYFADLMKPIVPNGMTIYAEICGYEPGSLSMIQKGYDYGCSAGKSFVMPYRIVTESADGGRKEWSVREVYDWTSNILETIDGTKEWLRPITILYEGKFSDLYPEAKDTHDIFECLKADKDHFGMEQNEPMCTFNKVPREGIVLRINGNQQPEAFKLKTVKFLGKEAEEMDKATVDVEMQQNSMYT